MRADKRTYDTVRITVLRPEAPRKTIRILWWATLMFFALLWGLALGLALNYCAWGR